MPFEIEIGGTTYIFDKSMIISEVKSYNWLKGGDAHIDEAGELCWVCRIIDFEYLFTVATADIMIPINDVPGHAEIPVFLWGGLCLGSVRDLQVKSSCRCCAFILQSLNRLDTATHDSDPPAVGATGTKPSTRVYLRGLIRGRTMLSFRRAKPTSSEPPEPAPIQLFIYLREGSEPLKSSPLLRPIQRIGSVDELPAISGTRRASLGGRLVTGDEVEMGVLRRWVSACRETAQQPCPAPTIRLIDIPGGFVTDAFESPPEYVALSYVWGKVKNLMLTAQTAANLQTPGTITANNPDIPLTIRDAILACQLLSLPYLWVDSLCIEQDSPLKMATIEQMDAIYGCARLTLVAAAGADAQAGLPGVRAGTRPRRQRAVHIAEGVLLAEVLPTFKAVVDQSTWNSRGWTYQERLLSDRKLYFTDEQTYYECPHGCSCEDKLFDPHESGGATSSCPGDDDAIPGGEIDDKYQIEQKGVLNYAIYEGVVREFTARTLGFEEDADAAFKGVSNALQLRVFNGSPMLFGMPLCCIDAALLWHPSGRMERRRRRLGHPTSTATYFPSWTWMGWKGRFVVESVGNESERIRSRVEWLDARDAASRLPRASTGMPPSSWPGWSQWAHHVDQHGFGFYTPNAVDNTETRFCHPVPGGESSQPVPVDPVSGLLFMRAEVAHMAVSISHTGRWDQESSCADGDHASATCQLWILDGAGKRAGVVYVRGEWLLGKDSGAARSGLTFIKLSQQTYSLGDSDPAWDQETCTYKGTPGSPAINPQGPLGPEDEAFDQTVYDRNICWCLCNVLLVEWAKDVAYRVGIGQVHVHAFDCANPAWRTVALG